MWTNNLNSPEAIITKFGADYSQHHADLLALTPEESRAVVAAYENAETWRKAELLMYEEAFTLAEQTARMRNDAENAEILHSIGNGHRRHDREFRGLGVWYLGITADQKHQLLAVYYKRLTERGKE